MPPSNRPIIARKSIKKCTFGDRPKDLKVVKIKKFHKKFALIGF
jgi:hypothetical protein